MPTPSPARLSNAELTRLFAADLEVQRIEFTVSGHACWMDLKPLDHSEMKRMAFCAAALQTPDGNINPEALTQNRMHPDEYIVSRTVVNWSFVRVKSDGSVVYVVPSEVEKERQQQILDFKFNFKFWQLLVRECHIVNGLDPDSQGN